MFDTDQIRRQFPIFSVPQNTGRPLVYFDNAATTHKPMVVLERLQRFYGKENANIHRGIYRLAHEATKEYELARSQVATFINAASADEIIFCSGTTEALNMVAHGLAPQLLGPGDEVLVTAMEHHANFVPWQMVCKLTGASFRVAPVNKDGTLDMSALKASLSDKTRVLAIAHISNSLGTINPIQEIVALAKKKNIITVVDGAQCIAFDKVDVRQLDCDFYAFSGHKVFGPMGIGVLYGKMKHLERLAPYQQGGSMILQVTEAQTTFKPPPHGFEAGTPPVAEAIALATALEFATDLGLSHIKEHSQSTLQYARERLSSIQGLQQKGPKSETSNIISFTLDNIHPHDVATILGEAGVAVRAGHHCTQPLMHALGINSTVRASFSIYNGPDEVDHFIDSLKSVNKILS